MEIFCDSIVKNKRIGLYDGAYKSVALATGRSWERLADGTVVMGPKEAASAPSSK